MQAELIIKLLNGKERFGFLNQEFEPTTEQVDFFCTGDQTNTIVPLSNICYIKFLGKPDLADSFSEDEFFEDISTSTGERFHLRLKKVGKRIPQGFYGYPVDIDSAFKTIFFTSAGLKKHSHEQPIGEVLNNKGLVTKEDFDAALQQQRELRAKRVGEILSEQADVPQVVVDTAIENASRNDQRKGRLKVGDILVEAGLVSQEQVEDALKDQASGKRKRIGLILIERGLITEDQLLEALAQKFGLEIINLEAQVLNNDVLKLVPREMVERMQVLPISLEGTRLKVATANPTDPTISENLRFATNCQVELVCASSKKISEKISVHYQDVEDSVEDLIDEMDTFDIEVEENQEPDRITESDSKVINLVNKILLDAHKKGVSDIHFEPGLGPQPLKIRYRRDGLCYTVHQLAATYKMALISRIKIISKLDIAEHRRPQSGKILLKQGKERMEFRVEITPTIGGQEDAVLRVLSSSRIISLDELGFSAGNLQSFKKLLQKPYGIILCVGPTGSGKTTSLHSALAEINSADTKIWTAEDPVEITQPGLRQVQVHPKIGFNFEEALRSFLRADPDVIMIGEMRDPVTAKTAIGASLTGHRVFSTLHTNNAPETIVRLIEMGMDPFNFADAMLGILAQRLARLLCNECKEPYHPDKEAYNDLVASYGAEQFKADQMPKFSKDLTLMKAVGCDACDGSGYSGRIAVQELLINSLEIKKAIKRSADVDEITRIAIEEGMRTLRMDGIQKIFLGLTDLYQINRVSS